MFANRKKTLLIAVGALLASSTAVAVLTFQSGTEDAAASGSTEQTLPEELAGNTEVTGLQTLALTQPLSSAPGSSFSPRATDEEGSAGAVVEAEPEESASAPANLVHETHGASAPSHGGEGSSTAAAFSLNRPQLLALSGGATRGGSGLPTLPGPSRPDSQTPDAIDDPEEEGCDAFTRCGSLNDPPGPIPGDDPIGKPPVAVSVPEPGTMGLMMLGLALAAGVRRRRHA